MELKGKKTQQRHKIQNLNSLNIYIQDRNKLVGRKKTV